MKNKNTKEYMKWRARTTAKILIAKHLVYRDIRRLLQRNLTHEDGEQLFSAKDVQNLFSIRHSTYYRWISLGTLTPTIVNRRHYYRKEEIMALLEKRKYRQRGGLG